MKLLSLLAKWTVIWFITVGFVLQVYSQDAYCFKFTWLGPEYDNQSLGEVADRTCEEMKLSQPCFEPLIITYDGTPPNTTYMWEHVNRDDITCKLSPNRACMKWVNYYNGKIDNITYFCGKMTVNEKKSSNNDCVEDKKGAYLTVACACRTPKITDGARIPCNSAVLPFSNIWISLFLVPVATLVFNMKNQIV